MRSLIITLAALLLLPAAARAQTDVPYTTTQQPAVVPYSTMQQPAAAAPAPDADRVAEPAPAAEPAPVADSVPAAVAAPTGGHTPISDDVAKAVYDQCVSKPQAPMSAQSQASFCACTADRMKQTMTVEDKQVLVQNDQAGRDMLNRMLLDVYAPCMNFPVQDLLENQCLQDTKSKPLPAGVNIGAICHCMAAKTGAWFTVNGRNLMAQVLQANPNITDPMGPVTDDPSFKKASSDNLNACLTGGGAL